MTRSTKNIFLIIAFMVLTVVIFITGKQPAALPKDSESFERLHEGEFQFVRSELKLIDNNRPTQANGSFEGADYRELDTAIWYPGDDTVKARPLIIYSHGFSSGHRATRIMQRYMASHGYVVVAPNFPLTKFTAPGGPLALDIGNQAGDVSFLIDEVLRLNNDPDSNLFQKVDASRIGVMGISMGGLTSTLAAFHPTEYDRRIDAVASIAGPFGMLEKSFFTTRHLPYLMIATDIDAIVPYSTNALPVLDRVRDAQLLTVKNGSHVGFADGAAPFRWFNNPDSVGCFIVNRNLADEDTDDPRWQGVLGPASLGINYEARDEVCTIDPLPEALNVLRQTQITRLAVRAFFDSHLASDLATRESARRYLQNTLTGDFPETELVTSRI